MMKLARWLALVALAGVLVTSPASATLQQYEFRAPAQVNGAYVLLPGATVNVYLNGTTTRATIYDKITRSPISNPMIADINGIIAFQADSSASYQLVWSTGLYTSPAIPYGGTATPCAFSMAGDPCVETVPNNAALAAIPSTSPPVTRAGYAAAGDGPTVVYAASGSACSLNAGAGDGGSQVPTSDGKCWIGQITAVDNRIWGAKNDCATDDTTADQAAINYALATTGYAKTLFIGGRSLVSSSLIVNRAVNGTLNDFIVTGYGLASGFCATAAINIFDSSTTFSTDPVSERITFKDISFVANNPATAAYAISNKFLRVTFDNASFYQIKAVNSSIYLQSWHFINHCYATQYTGTFFNTTGSAFDLLADGMEFENGIGNGFNVGTAVGVRLINNVYESGASFYQQTGSQSVEIVNNYFEENSGVDVNLNSGGTAKGVVYQGNFHSVLSSSGSFYPVVLGGITQGTLGGNYSNKNLYDDSNIAVGGGPPLADAGSGALGTLNKSGISISMLAAGVFPRQSGITAYAGGGQTNAVLLTAAINEVKVCGAGGTDSVKLQPSLSGSFGWAQTVVNTCSYSIQVFGSASDQISLNPSATGVSQASGTAVTYLNYAPGYEIIH